MACVAWETDAAVSIETSSEVENKLLAPSQDVSGFRLKPIIKAVHG